MSPFEYKPRSKEAWEKRQTQQGGTSYSSPFKDEYNIFGPHDGDNAIRILPPTWGTPQQPAEHYGMDVWVHFNVGEGGSVLCLSKMRRQACPICEAQAKFELAGREDADDYKPKRRVAVWLLDRKAEKQEENPCIWSMGWTTDRDFTTVCKDKESGELYQIDNPESGFDVYFTKMGKGDQTKYVGHTVSRRSTSVDAKFLEFIAANPIPSTLVWRSYEEVRYLFEGEAIAPDKPKEEPPQSSQTNTQSASTTQPTVATQPAMTANPYCYKQVKIKGETLACGLAPNHDGDCDFVIGISAPVTSQLVLTPTEFCSKTAKMGGKQYGCSIVGTGHAGDCDFSREVTGNGVAASPTQVSTGTTALKDRIQKAKFETGQKG